MADRPLILVNRVFLATFAVILVVATLVAVREMFFSLPPCPDGGNQCSAIDAHWTGSRLVAMVLAGLWIVVALWGYAARAVTRRGRGAGWLIPFWLLPVGVALAVIPVLF